MSQAKTVVKDSEDRGYVAQMACFEMTKRIGVTWVVHLVQNARCSSRRDSGVRDVACSCYPDLEEAGRSHLGFGWSYRRWG